METRYFLWAWQIDCGPPQWRHIDNAYGLSGMLQLVAIAQARRKDEFPTYAILPQGLEPKGFPEPYEQ